MQMSLILLHVNARICLSRGVVWLAADILTLLMCPASIATSLGVFAKFSVGSEEESRETKIFTCETFWWV